MLAVCSRFLYFSGYGTLENLFKTSDSFWGFFIILFYKLIPSESGFFYILRLKNERCQLGNNRQLAKALDITVTTPLDRADDQALVWAGEFATPLTAAAINQRINDALQRPPLHIPGHQRLIKTIAWCTGAAQDYIDLAAAAGMDAFISGEISERTVHSAREQHIDYFAAGHHATERGGVKALCQHIQTQFPQLTCTFMDVDNPV